MSVYFPDVLAETGFIFFHIVEVMGENEILLFHLHFWYLVSLGMFHKFPIFYWSEIPFYM